MIHLTEEASLIEISIPFVQKEFLTRKNNPDSWSIFIISGVWLHFQGSNPALFYVYIPPEKGSILKGKRSSPLGA